MIGYLETLKPTLGFNSKPIWGRIFKVKMFQVIKLLKNTEIHNWSFKTTNRFFSN